MESASFFICCTKVSEARKGWKKFSILDSFRHNLSVRRVDINDRGKNAVINEKISHLLCAYTKKNVYYTNVYTRKSVAHKIIRRGQKKQFSTDEPGLIFSVSYAAVYIHALIRQKLLTKNTNDQTWKYAPFCPGGNSSFTRKSVILQHRWMLFASFI